MIRKKFDINLIKYISLFESMTRTNVKDCLEKEGKLIYVVAEGQVGKAVGKNGTNIKKITNLLKKKIKIIEYNQELIKFVRNVIMPNKALEIVEEEGIITITPPDSQTRGMLIGRAATNLREYEEIVKRFFEITEIKVI